MPETRATRLDDAGVDVDHSRRLDEAELIAQALSSLTERARVLEERLAAVEKVNARLEQAALTTARALQEISGHWDAVYEAMRREEGSGSAHVVYSEEPG